MASRRTRSRIRKRRFKLSEFAGAIDVSKFHLALHLKNDLHAVRDGLFQHAHIEEITGIDEIADVLFDHVTGTGFTHSSLNVRHHHRPVHRFGSGKPDLNRSDNIFGFLCPGK